MQGGDMGTLYEEYHVKYHTRKQNITWKNAQSGRVLYAEKISWMALNQERPAQFFHALFQKR